MLSLASTKVHILNTHKSLELSLYFSEYRFLFIYFFVSLTLSQQTTCWIYAAIFYKYIWSDGDLCYGQWVPLLNVSLLFTKHHTDQQSASVHKESFGNQRETEWLKWTRGGKKGKESEWDWLRETIWYLIEELQADSPFSSCLWLLACNRHGIKYPPGLDIWTSGVKFTLRSELNTFMCRFLQTIMHADKKCLLEQNIQRADARIDS